MKITKYHLFVFSQSTLRIKYNRAGEKIQRRIPAANGVNLAFWQDVSLNEMLLTLNVHIIAYFI